MGTINPETMKRIRQIAAAKQARAAALPTTARSPEQGQEIIDWAQMLDDYSALGGGADFWQFEPGENRVRFLMNPDGYAFYACRLQTYIPSCRDDGKGMFVVSPKTVDTDAYCPISALCDKLKAMGIAAGTGTEIANRTAALVTRLTPRELWLSNALVREAQAWRPVVVQYSRGVFKALVTQMRHQIDADAAPSTGLDDGLLLDGNIAHPQHGCMIVVERTGKGLGTRYSVTVTAKVCPVDDAQLAHRTDVRGLCQPTDVADIEMALCKAFGFTDFAMAVSATGTFPVPALDASGDIVPYASSPMQRQPVAGSGPLAGLQPMAQVPSVAEEDLPVPSVSPVPDPAMLDAAIPPCIASYGKPQPGLDCKTCSFATECEGVTVL